MTSATTSSRDGVADDAGRGGDARSARRIAAVDRADDHRRASCRSGTRLPTVRELSRAPRRVADHGQRGVAQPRRRRRDRGAWPQRHVRPAADRAGRAAPVPADHRGARALRARPVVRHARPGAAARPRPGRVARRQAVADVELPRPPGAAGAGGRAARVVAVRARGDDGRRRGDGRPRPRRPGRAAPRRPGRRRAPQLPAAARPARPARAATSSASTSTTTGRPSPGLRAALAAGDVRAVFLQPRAQNPAGAG